MFFALLTNAQDKNEYMVIEFNYNLKNEIQISIDGKQYLEEKADYSPTEKAAHNINPLFKKVTEYEAKGWELMYFHTIGTQGYVAYVYFAYLKKKKVESK